MKLNMIVAAGRDGAIGREGNLIWRISDDLKRFKRLTTGHPVIMGRKTWESLPKRPLPGRRNVILTRNPELLKRNMFPQPAMSEDSGVEVVGNVEEVVGMTSSKEAFVIGGEQIYRLFLPHASRIFLTEIDDVCPDADARFSFPKDEWEAVDVSEWQQSPDGVRFRYVEYERIKWGV